MSRCFPFPPLGYSGKCSSNEALILSIKLQREKEKSNSDREREKAVKSSEKKKDRKKEKKEKKREERRASSIGNNEKQKLLEKLYQPDKSGVEPKCSQQEDELEHLEKSNVTEEHGRPYLQNVSSSTDSTGNSCKRKRPAVTPNGIQTNGNIIRISLSSSYKRDEPSTSGCKEQEIIAPLHTRADLAASHSKVQPCSNIVRAEVANNNRDGTVKAPPDFSHLPSTSNAVIQSVLRQDKVVSSLPSGKTELVAPKEKLSSHEKKLRKKESKYNKLFDSWVPSLETGLMVDGDDADDWLLGKKGEDRLVKRLKRSDPDNSGDNLPGCAAFALQPRAQFLSDVDIYALPFTVPF